MTPHWELRQGSLCALGAGLATLIVAGATSPARADDAPWLRIWLWMPRKRRRRPSDAAARAPATFFRINDAAGEARCHARPRTRMPVRFAALTPSNIATGAAPSPAGARRSATSRSAFHLPRARRSLVAEMAGTSRPSGLEDAETLRPCEADAGKCHLERRAVPVTIGAVNRNRDAKLDEANRAVNMVVRYGERAMRRRRLTLLELAPGRPSRRPGDREDYAMRRPSAREAGFPREDQGSCWSAIAPMRQDHAVLAARVDGQWLVLDNRRSELIEDSGRRTLAPLFAIDHAGVHLFAAPYAQRRSAGPAESGAPRSATKRRNGVMRTSLRGSAARRRFHC